MTKKNKKGEKKEKKFIKTEDEAFKLYNAKIIISGSCSPMLLQLNQDDTILDIKQAILDRHDCFFRTCISVYNEKGQKLDDTSDIGNYIVGEETLVLKIADKPYTFKDAMIHINRFNEVVNNNNPFKLASQVALICGISIDDIIKEKKLTTSLDETKITIGGDSLLSKFYSCFISKDHTKCIKSLRLSFYNPPRGFFKLSGHLIYLDIVTLEGVFYGITSTVEGFYINASTINEFNPVIINIDKRYCTLDALVSSVSFTFKKKTRDIQMSRAEKHPFEVLPLFQQSFNWLGIKFELNENIFQTLELITNTHCLEDSIMSNIRDWNDELQSIIEMPQNSENDKIIRDKYLYKFHLDMTTTAQKVAVSIINGRISPINDAKEQKYLMYLWNNMFICIAGDSPNHYREFGGDIACHVSAGLDLHAIHYLNTLNMSNLYLLGTTIVDYHGYRLVVQLVFPGIFHRNTTQALDNGSVNHGKSIFINNSFQELAKTITEKLHFVPQKYIDNSGKEYELFLSIETKGVLGTDNRRYFLDFYKFFPPDPAFISSDLEFLKSDQEIFPCKFEQAGDIVNKNGFQFPKKYP
ncbi:hypothetical protein HZS_3992, partial [Henneguya salminicola]